MSLAAWQALESSCHEAVDVPAEGGVMTITSTLPSGGDIGELWSAMKVAGLLDKHCQWIAGVRQGAKGLQDMEHSGMHGTPRSFVDRSGLSNSS